MSTTVIPTLDCSSVNLIATPHLHRLLFMKWPPFFTISFAYFLLLGFVGGEHCVFLVTYGRAHSELVFPVGL